MTFKTFVKKIDFPALRRQKALIRALRQKLDFENDKAQVDALHGLAHLLDDLMDEAAKTLSEQTVFGTSTNDGCIDHVKCPECGYEAHFYISAESEFTVSDDGTDDHSDVEWDAMSFVRCGDGACNHDGRLWEFQS